MKLSTAIKVVPDGNHRVLLPHQTFDRALHILERFGITDICDLTDYDGIAIPVWAVRQTDYQGLSGVRAYGKGISSIQSRVSAMMEAIEHYSARHLPSTVRRATYNELRQQEQHILDLHKVTHGIDVVALEHSPIEWLPGTDLATNETIWVPAPCVLLHPALANAELFPQTSSNGLASGNVVEEAVCHALCELIERDAWTLAWLRMVTIPYIRQVANHMVQRQQSEYSAPLVLDGLYLEIDRASVPDDTRELIARFERVGAALFIRDITSDIGIPTFLAISRGEGKLIHHGMGSHPNASIAILRAITECAQSWSAEIHPSEKDRVSQYVSSAEVEQYQQSVFSSEPGSKKRDFLSISSYMHLDILDDIKYMICQLSSVGLQQIIVVDITLPGSLPVVRVLIPDIENWSMFRFSMHNCRLGLRGRRIVGIMDV